MSVYREMNTNMNDQQCLVDALKEVRTHSNKNFNPKVHGTPVQLEGYEGKKRTQTAEIVLSRSEVGSASNDIGFTKTSDGNFKAIISDYDKQFYNEAWMKDLKKIYVEKKVRKEAKKANLQFVRKIVTPQGKVQLQFEQI